MLVSRMALSAAKFHVLENSDDVQSGAFTPGPALTLEARGVSGGMVFAHDCCSPTSDQGPAFHCAGHGTRLHGLRLSGRSPLQYLKWTERFVPSWRG